MESLRAKLNQADNLVGTLTRVFFTNEASFTTGLLKVEGLGEVTVAGSFLAQEGDFINVTGTWMDHPRYGLQLKVKGASPVAPDQWSESGLIEYLARNKDFKGIGEVKARDLVLKSGGAQEAVSLLNEAGPRDLALVLRVSPEAAADIQEAWKESARSNANVSNLMALGLTLNQAKKILLERGPEVIQEVEKDPFILYEFRGFGFKRCDDIARKLGVGLDSPTRIKAGIHWTLLHASQDGHCFLPWMKAHSDLDKLLQLDILDSLEVYRKMAEEMVDEDYDYDHDEPAIYSDAEVVALHGLWSAECYLSDWVNLANQTKTWAFKEYSHFSPFETLNESQAEAVAMINDNAITAIHGAAGTGKSYMVKVLAQICKAQGKACMIMAPTGKAARRISQMFEDEGLYQEAHTIHKVLRFNGGEFMIDEPISTDIIVIDETSMVDSVLLASLIKWIPAHAKIVMVGDPNQLPPVGPGCPFHDMVHHDLVPVHKLGTVVRQAGILKANCTSLLQGHVAKTQKDEEKGLTPWVNMELTPGVISPNIIEALRRLEDWGYDIMTDVQVITPQHKTDIGTRMLNESIQRYVQKALYGFDVPPVSPQAPRLPIRQGDKVIAMRNDYELGYRNGDLGIALELGENVTIRMQHGKEITFSGKSDALNDFTLGYAITIHKAQGSEWPVVLAVISSQHSFMLSQSLIYTAATRSRERLILMGDSRGKQRAVNSKRSQVRFTLLGTDLEGGE